MSHPGLGHNVRIIPNARPTKPRKGRARAPYKHSIELIAAVGSIRHRQSKSPRQATMIHAMLMLSLDTKCDVIYDSDSDIAPPPKIY